MTSLIHPRYGFRLELSDEAATLQQAFWRTGTEGHVTRDNGGSFGFQVPVDYAMRLLPPLLDRGEPECRPQKLLFVTEPPGPSDLPDDGPDLASYYADPHRWADRMVDIRFMEPSMLPFVIACANWLADVPRPNVRASPISDNQEASANDLEDCDPD